MSRKNSSDVFGDLGEWQDAFRVRHRWQQHELPPRLADGHRQEARADKAQHRRRHSKFRGLMETE